MAKKKTQQKQIGSLELKKSKKGATYLSGTIEGTDYIAFKSSDEWMSKHPTAPTYSGYEDLDYEEDDVKEYSLALWSRVSASNNKYLSGICGDKKIVAFYDSESLTFRVYEQREPKPQKPAKKGKRPNTDGLPF